MAIKPAIKFIMFIVVLTQLFQQNAYCAESHIFNEIRIAINSSLPKDWNVFSVEADVNPRIASTSPFRWSFSDDKCWLIKVFGPNMSGTKYYDKNGIFLGQRKISNESIFIWVGDDKFDPKLTLWNRIKNRFSIVPDKIPMKIFEYRGFTVYAKEGGITLPENEYLEKTSIPGTYKGEYLDFEKGRSWPTWAEDLKKKLEEHLLSKDKIDLPTK